MPGKSVKDSWYIWGSGKDSWYIVVEKDSWEVYWFDWIGLLMLIGLDWIRLLFDSIRSFQCLIFPTNPFPNCNSWYLNYPFLRPIVGFISQLSFYPILFVPNTLLNYPFTLFLWCSQLSFYPFPLMLSTILFRDDSSNHYLSTIF